MERAGGSPWSFSVPFRSIKASSKDSGSMAGERAFMSSRISPETATYFAMSPRTTTASGQSFMALNMGMADRTPWMRAM